MRNNKKWFLALGVAAMITASGFLVSYANQQQDAPDKPQVHAKSEDGKKAFREGHAKLLEFLKLDQKTFKEKMDAGKTLGAIAKEQGISEQDLKDFMIKGMTQRIDDGVKAGKITAEKAEKMKSNMDQRVTDMINGKMAHHKRGPGMFANQELLTLLKMDAKELKTELHGGKTLAAVAKEHGVAEQDLKDVMVKAFNARIDEGLKSGKLTADKAERMKANAETHVSDIINGKVPHRAPQNKE